MTPALVAPTNVAALRRSIAKLEPKPNRALTVRSVYKSDSGYYVEDLQLEELESEIHGTPRRKVVLHCGQLATARGGTKYYKSSESLMTDLVRLFTTESAPPILYLEIIGWWVPFEDVLDTSSPDSDAK